MASNPPYQHHRESVSRRFHRESPDAFSSGLASCGRRPEHLRRHSTQTSPCEYLRRAIAKPPPREPQKCNSISSVIFANVGKRVTARSTASVRIRILRIIQPREVEREVCALKHDPGDHLTCCRDREETIERRK